MGRKRIRVQGSKVQGSGFRGFLLRLQGYGGQAGFKGIGFKGSPG
jgi:hypothetical protein